MKIFKILSLLALTLGSAHSFAAIIPGQVRLVETRDGAPLRSGPGPIAPVITGLPYHSPCEILSVQGWACYCNCGGTTGWVKCSSLIAPASLSGGTAAGPATSHDVTVGGRQ